VRAENCSKQDVRRSGAAITFESVCRLGDTTVSSQGTVTGSFDSGYTMKMTSKREGGPAVPGMPAETKTTIEAKWTGPCKGDQKPGRRHHGERHEDEHRRPAEGHCRRPG
jgi:hypothetical protein